MRSSRRSIVSISSIVCGISRHSSDLFVNLGTINFVCGTVCCVCHLSEGRHRAARWPHITSKSRPRPTSNLATCCAPAPLLARLPVLCFYIYVVTRHTNHVPISDHLDPLIPCVVHSFPSLTAAREFNLLDQIRFPLPAGQGLEKSIGTTRCKPNRSESPRSPRSKAANSTCQKPKQVGTHYIQAPFFRPSNILQILYSAGLTRLHSLKSILAHARLRVTRRPATKPLNAGRNSFCVVSICSAALRDFQRSISILSSARLL